MKFKLKTKIRKNKIISLFFIICILSISFFGIKPINRFQVDFSGAFFSNFINNILWVIPDYTLGVDDNILKENERLKEKESLWVQDSIKLLTLQAENDFFRKFFNISKKLDYSFVVGQVIGILNDSSALVNLGMKDSLDQKSYAVINSHGLVGVTDKHKTANNYLVVKLLHTQGLKVPVLGLSSRIRAIAVGDGYNMKLTLLSSSNHFQVGEKIITSGDGEKFPPNMLIGYIRKKDNMKKDHFYIELINDYQNIDFVSVVYPDNKTN